MKFFGSGRGEKKLRTTWEYRSKSTIWRIYPTMSDWIIGEERDPVGKKAIFFSLNRHSGKVAWSKALLEDWWVGVEAVTENSIILHGFATPDMPMHKGITAVDVATGNRRWEQPDLCFERMGRECVIGSRGSFGNRRFTSVEASTGQVLNEWMDPDASIDPDHENDLPSQRILFPVTTPDVHSGVPSSVEGFLTQRGFSGPVSWAATGSSVIVSYQVSSPSGANGQTSQHVSVITISDDTERFSDIVATGAGVFIPDPFLIQEGMLYYVRNQRDLVAVNLAGMSDHHKEPDA